MTVVKTKIGQDPLINKVLLNSDTVRPYRSLPARAIRMSTFASNPFFTSHPWRTNLRMSAQAAVAAACRAVSLNRKRIGRVRRKLTLVCDPWFVGCNQGAGMNCTPAAFQHPLIRLRFLFFP